MTRTIVCRCEDVTSQDVAHAWQLGHRHMEAIKRYTGFGTGPCEGKECLGLVARACAKLQQSDTGIQPFTARPPVAPVALRALANLSDAENAQSPALQLPSAPPSWPSGALPEPPIAGQPPAEPLPKKAEVVIVGAGIMGLGLAYELTRRGLRDIVVLDKAYLNYGASGRNGGGLRVQWSTELNIRVMQESMELCRSFASRMRMNIWLRRGGYLFLARTAAERAIFERNIALQNRLDVPTRLLEPRDIASVQPEVSTGGVTAAAWNPNDAVIFPWPFLWGYAREAERCGARVHTFTPVTSIVRDANGIAAVETPRGTIETRTLVAATGAWTPVLGKMVGVEIPSWPHRHEILSTEPLKPWLGPLVAELGSGLYFSQSMRGEIVGGIGLPDNEDLPHEARRVTLAARLRFLREMSRGLLRVVPRLSEVRVLRQWSGPYDMTPDGHPLLGPHEDCAGLWLCSGFIGHGFMMAPAIARHLADAMTGRARHTLLDQWSPNRFKTGALLRAETMNIG